VDLDEVAFTMSFLDTVLRAKTYLEGQGRVSLGALKLEFELDDARLESLIEELVDIQQVAAREGKALSWVGSVHTEPSTQQPRPWTTPAASSEPAAALQPADAEHRHLTVMFCDLVGSTDLSQRLDAEDLRNVVRAYQESASSPIERYAGHIAQYLGDGLLVYFGYPQAHEEDAERAILAGRDVLRGIEMLSARVEAEHGVPISARVGIHTGPVVVGEMGGGEKKEILALGDTPNIAARLEGFAEPGTVVISDATLRLVSGLFVTEDRGTPELKGISKPIRVHKVLQPSGVTSRLDRASTITSFVGREQELGLLQDRFEQVRESRGQAVLIGGEAGIGKSRLVYELRERLRDLPHSWMICRTSPYTQSSAFYPLIEMLAVALDFKEKDAVEDKLERLEQGLERAGLEPDEAAPLFASLLSLPLPERYAPRETGPLLHRQKTLEMLLAWVLALGEKQPLVLVVEDLHWIDPSTLEWLGLVIEQCPTASVLLLLTHRPNFEPPWPARAHLLPISLSRLGRRHVHELITSTIPAAALPEEIVERIATRSDGVPLFVEELAKRVVESRGADTLDVPETLQDSLMARLDRLGEAKLVAQLGSAIGREFEYTLLESVARLPDAELREGLGRLVDAELIYQRGLPPRALYTFKHALVQDTAYASLLKSQRKDLHGRVADALEARFPERVAREPEVLARHCEASGRTRQAIAHYQEAGERAAQRFAHAEAVTHLRRGIDLLREFPESEIRDEQELRLRIVLGPPLQAVLGMNSAEVEETYARALSLCQISLGGIERFQALSGLATYYRNREVTRALDLGEELLTDAERTGEASHLLFAHSTLGVTLHFRGEFSKALAHQDQAIALYDPTEHRSLEFVYGLDPGISSLCLSSISLLQLGHPGRARNRVEAAIEQSREHLHPYSLAYALNWGAILHHVCGRPRLVLKCAEEAIEISTKGRLSQQLGGAVILRASALGLVADAESADPAVDSLQRAVRVSQPPPVSGPFWGAIADTFLRHNRLDDALFGVNCWLAYSAEIHAPYWDAEFQRLKGEILLAKDDAVVEEAERFFLRAIATARSQDGRYFELRAALSLARLWSGKGKKVDARNLLAPIYDWFTEGFDTKDLKDSKALLEELES
jgi:class 3 adenylate cyclase/tetratricopeptide (TPR) repeat protein